MALGQGGNTPGNSPGGILISPEGLIQQALAAPINPAPPSRQLREKALTALPETLRQPAEIRLLSLRSLDSQLATLAAAGTPIPAELRYLAGLTRIDAIVLSPDNTDLILAGPAEPFAAVRGNRMVGLHSGRPVLRTAGRRTQLAGPQFSTRHSRRCQSPPRTNGASAGSLECDDFRCPRRQPNVPRHGRS